MGSKVKGIRKQSSWTKKAANVLPFIDGEGNTLALVVAITGDVARVFTPLNYSSVEEMVEDLRGWVQVRGVDRVEWDEPQLFPPGAEHLAEMLDTIRKACEQRGIHVSEGD